MGQNVPAKIVNMTQLNSSLFGFWLNRGGGLIFFMIPQVNGLLEPEYQDRTEESAGITHLGRNDAEQYPEKLLGYEALLDDYVDLDMPKPVGK